MTNSKDKNVKLLGQERRRRWSVEQKLAMVRESLDQAGASPWSPDATASTPINCSCEAVSAAEAVVLASEPSDALRQILAVDASNTRRCSDGVEFRCENGEKLSVTFALDCCDREAIGWVASPTGYSGDNIRIGK